ncbi:hypothetical protein CAEBREN_21205 [Caenorhabditis brenneri]|uniref:Uncharacterized protein n=1 Tax=Caenorhabditis brenneri TaxID=135651 RepID=G0N2D8_CAEBE|nr:hypothetical protein CAEBREN_21205 [Caenorhabditis brenneri]
MEHLDFETILMSQMENDQVKNYFTWIDKKNRAHVLINYISFFIPMVKSYTKTQLDAISMFFKEYPSFKNSNKVSFGNVLTKNTTRYACWDMWKIQKVSTEIEKMVKLVKMFEKEFGIKTCFSKVIDIRDIAQLSKFWDRIGRSNHERLGSMFPVNQTYRETFQTILTDTKTPSRSSYRHILKTVRGVIKDHSKSFSNFIEMIYYIHGSDYEPLWMTMKQFFEYSEDQRKEYINLHFADSNSSLAQFFKAIQPSSADDYDVTVLKPCEQWTDKQMRSMYDVVGDTYWMRKELANEKNQQTIEMVERVLEEKVSYKEFILTLTFLCSIANTEKILDPEEHYYPINGSIYDRLMNSPAAKDEKDTVMGSLKSILAHIPDPSNWTSFTEVIREGKLEENLEKLGGEKSKNAVYFLQNTLKRSRNKTALTGFLDACLEFLSLGNVSKTEKMLIMADFLAPSEYSTWYKGSEKLADVMGVKKVFIYSNSEESKVLTKFQNWTEIDSSLLFNGIDEVFKDLLDPRLLDFNFTLIETIEYNLMEHLDFETILMSQLENDRVKNYFTRINKKNRAHVLINYTSFFIPMVKSYTKKQLDAVSELLKEYTLFKNITKVSFGKVLTSNTTRYECWDLWKSQLVSTEMEKMVELVNMFKKEFDIETCFSKVIDIRDIAQLSEYWEEYNTYRHDKLTALLSVNQTFRDTLQVMLTDTKTPSRSSYRHILKTVRGVMKDHSEPFYRGFIQHLRYIHGYDYEPLWMAMKQFFEYSEEQRKDYINLHFADKNSSLAQFLKAIRSSTVDDLDALVLKPYDQWNTKQMDGIYHVVRDTWFMEYKLADKKNQQTIETVERVLEENVSYKECEDSWNFMKDDEFAKNLRKNLLDSKFINFDFTTVKNIENVLFEHLEYQSDLIGQLEVPVLDYFTKLSSQNRYDALEFYPGIFMEIVSNSTDQQLKAFTNFLREYTFLEKSTKEKFEEVMTKSMGKKECLKIWKSRLVSKEMERMVELVSMLYEEFGIETCMDKIVDIRNIPQLNRQWNHIPELPRLTTLLSSNQSNIDALRTMLKDTKTPSKESYLHLLTTIRSFLKEHPEFVEFMEDVQSVYGIDWEPVKKMVDPFLEYSEEQREMYIKLNFAQSNSSLKLFLNDITTENIEMITTLKKQWTKKQMDGIMEFVRSLHEVNKLIRKRIDELLAQNAERLFAEGVTDIQCASFWNDGLLGLAEPMHRAILSLEDAFGKMSCDWTAWPPH